VPKILKTHPCRSISTIQSELREVAESILLPKKGGIENKTSIKGLNKKNIGSIVYEFSFTPEQAARLFLAIQNGELDEFNVEDVKKVKRGEKIFIGHGRSPLWRELKDFLSDRLKLAWDEFNREAIAGYTISERLKQMLSDAVFAFLVMTGEDLRQDNYFHARENVIHEIGLFQGKLGLRKAIILLEDGCAEFSNISGLGQIHFPKGNISAAFEEVRMVLERDGIVEIENPCSCAQAYMV